jgi:2-keto-4-pentenoate hydratase
MLDPEALAVEIDEAHRDCRLLDADAAPTLDLDTAYVVQRLLTARRSARGSRRIGWKLGYTSAAMRAQMGVDQPNLGPLLDAMLVTDGRLPLGLAQPRVEPEIAVEVAQDGTPGRVWAALEIVDSVWRGYRFSLELNTADGSSAAGVVLGPELQADVLDELPVDLERNGQPVASATGAAAMGHPFNAVAWLAGELDRRGERLRAGELVLTGGLTAAVPLNPGDTVGATFGTGRRVEVHRP